MEVGELAGRVAGQVVVTAKSLGSAPVIAAEIWLSGMFCSLISVIVLGALVVPMNSATKDSAVGEIDTGPIALPLRLKVCEPPDGGVSRIVIVPDCDPRVVASRRTAMTQLEDAGTVAGASAQGVPEVGAT